MAARVIFQDQGCWDVWLERSLASFPPGPDGVGKRGAGLAERTCFLSHGSWKKGFPLRSLLFTPVGPHHEEGEERGSAWNLALGLSAGSEGPCRLFVSEGKSLRIL